MFANVSLSLAFSLAVTTAGGTRSPTRYLKRRPLGPGGGAGEEKGGGATPAEASAAGAGRGATDASVPFLRAVSGPEGAEGGAAAAASGGNGAPALF